MTLQVLVATMHQDDLRIAETMNIRCGAVIANQADREEMVQQSTESGVWKMITTPTRGVGLNRNIALMAADADILLFADDDVVYNDDMPTSVLDAFRQNPGADVIVFGMQMMKNGEITETRCGGNRRLHLWNSMRFGTYRIAVRRSALLANNITFHQCFGGGCPFGSGEDSLFLKSCFDAGLKVYSHNYILGVCRKDASSWFVGCDEKYFYDKGVLMRKLFPRCAPLMTLYFGICFKRETDLGVLKRLRLMYAGVRGGKKMIPYSGKA